MLTQIYLSPSDTTLVNAVNLHDIAGASAQAGIMAIAGSFSAPAPHRKLDGGSSSATTGDDGSGYDDRVVSIHGYVYPVGQPLPEAFFLHGADCWGWATWSRGWSCFNSDGQFLLDELKRHKTIRAFDFNGTYPFSKMLEGQIKGTNDSWAVRWYASAFLAGKLTLYPGRSLVHNIGNDDSGTHCGESADFDANLSSTQISLNHINSEPSQEGRQAFEDFFRQGQMGLLGRLVRKSRALIRAVGR